MSCFDSPQQVRGTLLWLLLPVVPEQVVDVPILRVHPLHISCSEMVPVHHTLGREKQVHAGKTGAFKEHCLLQPEAPHPERLGG
eukprot:1731484-Rhodomonas_salina.1